MTDERKLYETKLIRNGISYRATMIEYHGICSASVMANGILLAQTKFSASIMGDENPGRVLIDYMEHEVRSQDLKR